MKRERERECYKRVFYIQLHILIWLTLSGYTLLHCAAAWGQLETLKTLIELEADIYATTSRGEKARDIACRYEQTECVAFLDWAGKSGDT